MTSSIAFDFTHRPVVVRKLNTYRPTSADSVCLVNGKFYVYKQQGKIAAIYTDDFARILRRHEGRRCEDQHSVAGLDLIEALGRFKLCDPRTSKTIVREAKWQRFYDSKLAELTEMLHELGMDNNDEAQQQAIATATAYADRQVK